MCGRWGRIEGVGGVSIPVDSHLAYSYIPGGSHMCFTLYTSRTQVEVVVDDQLHNHLTLLMPVISPTVSVLAYTYMFLSVINKLFIKANLTNTYIYVIAYNLYERRVHKSNIISSNIQ